MSAFASADWVLIGRQVANHLWQSTLFAAVAGMLALSLRNHHARIRHWLWMAASLKFLVPFSLIVAIGGYFGSSLAPHASARRIPVVAEQIAQPFALPDSGIVVPSVPVPRRSNPLPGVIAAVWFCGFAAIVVNWQRKWRHIAKIVRASSPLGGGREVEALRRLQREGAAPLRLVSSTAKLEPGIFGIFRPVLWLPAGIGDYLSDAQLEAILAHELCHARRRDNLLAAMHMLVEAAFWFYPLVWWLGTRLEEERERACDEEVVRLIGEPKAYAEGMLKVCEFYLISPVFCAAGVTGADLKKRIEDIMTNRLTHELSLGKKVLLVSASVLAMAGPMSIGLINPPGGAANAQERPLQAPRAYDVCSVKPSSADSGNPTAHPVAGGGFTAIKTPTLALVATAFDVRPFEVFGLPAWALVDRYDVMCKDTEPAAAKEEPLLRMRSGLQALLADRFRLQYHRGAKRLPMVTLRVGKRGLKVTPSKSSVRGGAYGPTFLEARGWSMEELARTLTALTREKVIDKTGVAGRYDFDLEWRLEEPKPGEAVKPGGLVDISLLSALLNEKLGLRITQGVENAEVIFVDHIEKSSSN